MTDERTTIEIVTAILFAAGDAVSVESLSAMVDVPVEQLFELLRVESRRREEEGAGLLLRRAEDCYRLCTNPRYSESVLALLGPPQGENLTNPMLETLAIIAYKQPVTRVEIEQLRGVNSSYMINSLTEKGFIEESGRKNVIGHPILYSTTEKFLEHFGIQSVAELPPIDEDEQQKEPEPTYSDIDEKTVMELSIKADSELTEI